MPGDITVELSHVVPDAKPHHVFMRARTAGDVQQHSSKKLPLETTIHNGRDEYLKLDDTSFELFEHPTVLATEDFYGSDELIRMTYYDEMRELFKTATGCAHVQMFHHQVRNQDRLVSGVSVAGTSTNTAVQAYAHGIHSDSSPFHAEKMFQDMVLHMPAECRRGRFLYINAWRNISLEPIEDDHLAVLDERTLVKPDDYIQTHLHGVGYDVLQYNLSCRNAKRHKWYYFPKMTKDEVLVFKQWDSDPLRAGRLCFHTAIHDPTVRTGAPARQSVEVRAFLFFPDYKPDTCPPIQATQEAIKGECDEALAQEGMMKLRGALAYIEADDSIRDMVVGHTRAQHLSGGAKAILDILSKDEQRHHGLTDASTETQARVVELLLNSGAGEQVDRIFAGLKLPNPLPQSASPSN